MPITPQNPDLPSNYRIPGIFFSLNLAALSAGLNSVIQRILLVGYKGAGGTAGLNVPIQVQQQSDANNFFVQGSDLARMFASVYAQIGGGLADVYCLPIAEPVAGTQATHLITIAGPATAAGSMDVWICGYKASFSIANGDSANTIAGNLNTAIQTFCKDAPVISSVAGPTVTLTAIHKALTGNDCPIIVNVNGTGGSV